MSFMRLFATFAVTAVVCHGQHIFTAVSSGINSVGASAFLSQYDSYANSVVDDPRWTSATAALQTQAAGVAIVFSTNPLLMANDLFTATATPSWYPLISPDLQSYVYSLASVEAALYVNDKSVADNGGTSFAGLSAAASTLPPTTMTTAASPITTIYLQPTDSSSQSSGLSPGAKIGLGVGVGLGALVIIGLVVFGVIFCRQRRRRQREIRNSMSEGTTAVPSRPMTFASTQPSQPHKPYQYSNIELQGNTMPPEMPAGKYDSAFELPVHQNKQQVYELASHP